ncbi:galactose-1-epimerase [Vibrio alfacsensis]|uniref:galactose-1-epimerase n=1 Tax=Vibrio alfacsensis TaxID=1074311 RepID=UPI002ADE280F|nr:galactose-1-epimerase [Vibrio alfacsensis]WQE75630.1 galactose-1-epimerase [Vibrio alfacsensis]
MTEPLAITMTQQAAFDGAPANVVELKNNTGMSVTFMDIGATWLSCRLPLACGELREVLLGVGTMRSFIEQPCYMGVTVGRYANRIANGLFEVNGEVFQVSTNQAENSLHGGKEGFDKRRWKIEYQSEQQVTFALLSEDGDQGFPGNLQVQVTYTLTDDNHVSIAYFAKTDKATPVNLTNHAYFNLLGAEADLDCRSHRLTIDASQYLPTTDVGIPLGELQEVKGTGFDFRSNKSVSEHFLQDEQQIAAKGYDHSYLFDAHRDVSKPVALVVSPDEKVRMSVVTNKPAMQLYTGNWLAGAPNRRGGEYQDYAGLALETQFLPDSPNHAEWAQPSCILEPEQEYRFCTTYQFAF